MATVAPPTPRAELRLGQSIALAPIAQARMIGSQWFVLAYQIAGLLLGITLGTWLAFRVPIAMVVQDWLVPTYLPVQGLIVLCGVIGWSTGLSLAQWRHRAKFLAGIKARGTPDSVRASYAVEDAGLRITTPRVDYSIAWDAILEIVPSPETWLIQVDTITYLLDKRAFADPQAERAFLAEVLQRIRQDVRERSKEAAAFVAG
jgi:hypothetical protein